MATKKSSARRPKPKKSAPAEADGSFGNVLDSVTTAAHSVARLAKAVVGEAKDFFDHEVAEAKPVAEKAQRKARAVAREVTKVARDVKKAGRKIEKRVVKAAKKARSSAKSAGAAAKRATKKATVKRSAKKKTR